MLRWSADRLRRSVLYVPGINERALDKLHGLHCDAAILDLEDAVSPFKKNEARELACEAARKGFGAHKEIAIRINSLSTTWGRDDLAHVVSSGAHAVVIPKVDSPNTLLEVASIMDSLNAPRDMSIWAMIETPIGILNLSTILATPHPRLSCLVAGTSDLSKELRCVTTPCRHALVPSLAWIVLAARAHGLTSLDGVHLDLANDADFAQQLNQGKELGFDGKTLIHPKTIAATNAVFSPSQNELDDAQAIIAAYDEAVANGSGVALYQGKLIENLHVDHARSVLAKAARIVDAMPL
ncbi:hypothetical protein H310_02321 [Aphanomyces invadans]|uniref:HpcH/HpaI aldolase/citrate lyase domain-containing protein n=1 Tax=Aphanomyces invadans TaxID=157072 RepID=A0A024UNR6_9STRA|nr:hypothetical protein H310_02321 [Aphanomyces invadans]ETW07914.1 hypothetical protein H310_02321 [Aphanomyces invadans]|eukprot:XP_008864007.1 hypothetical protein H310_02321 [Aphanomyces invadans]